MTDIMQLIEQHTQNHPQASILYDDAHTRGITYAQLDDMSGRVYAYLKQQGIGTEDFVLIKLPRGILPVIAMFGVWKAGAAWALVEDTYAPERIAYIRKDCGCKVELNSDNWDDIMECEPLSGHEKTDPHDAAYAIYTSGTTGNPKGVLHEYGNLSRAIESIRVNGEDPFTGKERVALLAPMNFVASVILILKLFSIEGAKLFVVSYATIKNPLALKTFFLEKRISVTFLTPSYVRMLGNTTGPFLRMLVVGSEPANNLYNPNLDLINVYAASESGFAVGVFTIDKAYETCPIGKPEIETKITLIGEDGNEVSDGEVGELCFENPYVRGYLNLPEETAKAFQKGVYHSGDLARCDANGNYVLLGRSNDMIKINGNRIEPAEIEAAVKEALGIQWAAARGFEESGKSFLCAYYIDDIEIDNEKLRAELSKRLPYYMIPAYFIKIDKVPLKPNGKMDRKALPAPEADDFKTEYVAPENETQEKLCHGIENVLKLEQVGIHDDFYEMGGDSLTSIRLITESGLPGLNAGDIFRGRTPEKIAEIYLERRANAGDDSPDMIQERSIKQDHPLTAEMLYMVDYQLYTPKSTMYNLYTVMKMDKTIFEPQKLAQTMYTVIKNHPALLTTFHFNEDGEVIQRYTPDILEEIHVEKLSEFEFDNIKDNLVQPFKIIGGKLFRCRIFETEKNAYIFFDVHHTLFDGTSFKVFMANVGKVYMGAPPEPDYYYYMLHQREHAQETDFYQESKQYFEKRYDGTKWSSSPTVDHNSRENELGEIFAELGVEPVQLKSIENRYRISRNEFFITIGLLAIAIYNGKNDVKISWIYNGREEMELMHTVGLLFRDLPVGVHLNEKMTLRDLFADVHEQVQKGIEHCCYPYVDITCDIGDGEAAYVLYQQDIRDTGGLEDYNVETIDVRQNQAASQTILDMEILDGEDGLMLMIDFAASRYEDSSMELFRDYFVRLVQTIAKYDSQKDVTLGELHKKVMDKTNFFDFLKTILRRKM